MNSSATSPRKAAAVAVAFVVLLLTAGALYRLLSLAQRSTADAPQAQQQSRTVGAEATEDAPRVAMRERERSRARRDADPDAPPEASPSDALKSAAYEDVVDSDAPPLRPASVMGYVYDLDGVGIASAAVQLEVTPAAADASAGQYAARTGADGAYAIPNITHFGEALLSASAPGYAAVHSRESDAFGAPDFQWIEAGAHYERINFTLYKTEASLRGRVLTATQAGVEGARVVVAKQVCRHQTQEGYWTLSRENGAFQIDLPCDASCVVVAYKEGFAPAYLAAVTPGAGNITITLRDGGAIVGFVRDSRGEPIEEQKILITPKDPNNNPNSWMAPNPVTVASDKDGAYAAWDLSEKFPYTVQAPYLPETPGPLTTDSHSRRGFIQRQEQHLETTNRNLLSDWDRFDIFALAEVNNVVVHAGQETRVDLTIDEKKRLPAVVQGCITDEATGLPLSPFYIAAFGPKNDSYQGLVGMAVTQEDGAYRLLCHRLEEQTPITLRISYCLSAVDGSLAAVMQKIVLGPGDEVEVNHAMRASVTAPVRVVWDTGHPIPRVEVSGSIGSYQALSDSDSEGCLTLYGLAPYETHQLVAWADDDTFRSTVPLGSSAPFTGMPGETLPEIVITCPALGSLVGRVVLPDGVTENAMEIVPCHALAWSCAGPPRLGAFLSPDGTLRVPMAPPGVYTLKFLVLPEVYDDDDDYHYAAIINDVVVVSGQETDIGLVVTAYEEDDLF